MYRSAIFRKTSGIFRASVGTNVPIVIEGRYNVGQVLTVEVSSGFTVQTVQWVKKLNTTVTNISGATGLTYTIQAGDLGYTVYPIVTGYFNNTLREIVATPIAPTVVTNPVITKAAQGSLVEFTPATFAGTPNPTITNEWFVNGTSIGSITPIASIVGSQILLAQRASNSAGQVTAYSNVVTVVNQNPEDAVFSSALVVPFTNYLNNGELLVTDGTADYGARINSAMASLNTLYQADGIKRQLYFPAGTFSLSATTPSLYGYSGVGIKGAGSSSTKFIPVRSFMLTNPAYDAVEGYHENQLFSDFEVDCATQVLESGHLWYEYKAFYMRRCRLQYYKNVVCHDSLGTLFGLDYMDRCYFYDCIAYGSGRATTAQSGPGAGFGISIGREAQEICEFHRCISYNNKTGAYYYEMNGGLQAICPIGALVKDCISYGNYIGVDDCGCDGLIVEGGSHYNNIFAGVKFGANSVSTYNKGPINGIIRGSNIYGNGTAGSSNPTTGGVVFTYSVNVPGSLFRIIDTDIHDNIVAGIGNQFMTSVSSNGQLPSGLSLEGTTKLRNNGGPGLYFYHPTQVLSNFTVASSVSVKNNGTSDSVEIADGIALCCNSDSVNIACSGGDDLAVHRQQSVVAFRGKQFTAINPTVSGNLSEHVTISPIRMEHNVSGTFNNTATLNPSRPTSIVVTNYHKDTVAAGTFTPTVTNGTVAESSISTSPVATTSWVFTASSTSTLSMEFYSNINKTGLAVGDLYCLSFWVKGSNTNKSITTSANVNQNPVGICMIPALQFNGGWQRVMFFGRLKSTTFTTSLKVASPVSGDTVEITGLMFTKGPNLYDFFTGDINGGAWTGTANASTSTKTISV